MLILVLKFTTGETKRLALYCQILALYLHFGVKTIIMVKFGGFGLLVTTPTRGKEKNRIRIEEITVEIYEKQNGFIENTQ